MTKQYNYKKKADGIINKTGRPRKYDTPEEMLKAINKYFDKNKTKPTVHGLCLALDFIDRQSLLDYQGKDDFSCVIARAKMQIANRYEKGLYNKREARGCIFALNAMFGCREQSDMNVQGNMTLTDMAALLNAKRNRPNR